MTDTQSKRIHAIVYSTDSREELAERIVALEDENAKLKNNNNYLHEMLSESRQANEHLYTELKRNKSILRTRPNAMTALYDENTKLRELVRDMWRFTGTACKKYPRLFDPSAQGGQTIQLNQIDSFEQRMRELGLEEA